MDWARGITYIQRGHGALARFEGLENVDCARPRSQIVTAFAVQQGWMQKTPHVFGLDLRVYHFATHQYPDDHREKVVGAQRYVAIRISLLHLKSSDHETSIVYLIIDEGARNRELKRDPSIRFYRITGIWLERFSRGKNLRNWREPRWLPTGSPACPMANRLSAAARCTL